MQKKRNPKLAKLMLELQEQTKEEFKKIMCDVTYWITNNESFQFITDFINAMIIGSDVLEARENFKKNRQLLEKMLILIFEQGKEN
ncbi:hypothetical protein [Criibacterium bergeronii]|uniref:hypothetical protein n=1 Tax=Criibacterium bergeronii TaxID=1871336 RepID=UPI001FB12B6B|nr:hypothetical protein [Criibacterium bergeronii]